MGESSLKVNLRRQHYLKVWCKSWNLRERLQSPSGKRQRVSNVILCGPVCVNSCISLFTCDYESVKVKMTIREAEGSK